MRKEGTPMYELDSLRESLLEGELDRASFLRKALGLGLSISAAGALFAAWGRASASGRGDDAQARRHAHVRAQLRAGHARPVRRGRQRDDLDDHDDLRPARRSTRPASSIRSRGSPSRGTSRTAARRSSFHLRDAKFSERRAGDRRRRRVLAQPLQGPEGQQPAAVPRHEHRLGVGAGQEDRRDEAEAPRRRDPGEPLGVPGLDHAEGGRDEDGRQGVRAEPGRQRPVRRRRVEARPVARR